MSDFFGAWCDPPQDERVISHLSRLLIARDEDAGISAVSALIPEIYATKKNLEQLAKRRGKTAVAALLGNKMPTSTTGRSGDMGEILATIYIDQVMGYETGPSRLIERDHQEWAMRGDDAIGARWNGSGNTVELVKVEAKSRTRAGKSVIVEARRELKRNDDLISPHSLTQFAERLQQMNEPLSNAIEDLLIDNGIRAKQLTHVMFLFAGNHPKEYIHEDLSNYKGKISQITVTLRVNEHQSFIRRSYETVLNNV
ncbi:Hachiman antiphage defense system protein HamA [Bifidobacterium mongoliense]|uniref:Hachiman antiphage defense system protein HamA n=1 Tax=Bifidobacterium mongoliense TaxID=518643 RepID=UPI0030EC8283